MKREGPPRLVHVTTAPLSMYAFLRGQMAHMRLRGFEVHGVSAPGELLERVAVREGTPVHAVAMSRSIAPLADLLALARLRRLFARLQPAIVHAHTPKGGLLGMLAAWSTGVPGRIYHIRGFPWMTARGLRKRLLIESERLACRLAQRVLCVSRSLARVAVEEGLCREDKLVVPALGSGNGVDARGRFRPASESQRAAARDDLGLPRRALVAGFVGRLGRDKGLVDLAAAWSDLACRAPYARLLVVGPFEPRDRLPAETERFLRTHPSVRLLDFTPNVVGCYAAMDLCVLPSYREGFPNVLLEAAAMAVPSVATRIPGCTDAVDDGVTGRLVPPGDRAALTAALEDYFADAALRRRHGEAGRRRVLAGYQHETVWEAIYREYLPLLGHRPAPAARLKKAA